jgi:hypothetical protein
MVTVDQMIAALEAFKAEHGGERQVVKCDPYGNWHFKELDHISIPVVAVSSWRPGYFDMDDDENPDPNAVPVFVINEG